MFSENSEDAAKHAKEEFVSFFERVKGEVSEDKDK
jgi:hypothetical protein